MRRTSFRTFPSGARGGWRRPAVIAAWAAAATLLIAATSFWWWPGSQSARAPAANPASAAMRVGVSEGFVMPADTRPAETEAQARQRAQLSPLPETTRHPDMPRDAVARVRQRHATSHFFTDAQDIERARDNATLLMPGTATEAAAAMGMVLSERQKSDGRSFIRYEPRTLESRVEGDTLEILLPPLGVTAKAVIDRVDSVDGLLRWSGHLVDFQEGGTFSVTHALDDHYAIGSFDTPLGSFAMEVKNGWGWVAPPSQDFFLPAHGDDTLHAPSPTPPGGPGR